MYVRETELFHHGIKGQRWGVRRFQNEDGSLTIEGQNRYGSQNNKDYNFTRGRLKAHIKNTILSYIPVIGTVALSLSIANSVEKKYTNHKAVKNTKKADPADFTVKDKSLNLDSVESIDKAIKNVNSFSGNVNCLYCSACYDITRRGYNISAPGTERGANLQSFVDQIYKVPDVNKRTVHIPALKPLAKGKDKIKALSESIIKNGGKRGIIGVQWGNGRGHAISYEVFNGKVLFIDSQQGKILSERARNKMFDFVTSNSMEYIRTDDLALNIPQAKNVFKKGGSV